MKIPIYSTVKEFEKNYIKDFKKLDLKIPFTNYLFELQKIYSDSNLWDSEARKTIDILKQINEKYNSDEVFDDFILNIDYYESFEDYNSSLSNLVLTERQRDDFKNYFEKRLYSKSLFNGYEKRIDDILTFIDNIILTNEIQLENEKITILEQTEPSKIKQVKKIGLLIRSGLVNFFREKYNNKISDNQIAIFIESLTKKQIDSKKPHLSEEEIRNFLIERNHNIVEKQINDFLKIFTVKTLKRASINPHLAKENKKYAIQNQKDKDDLDSILNEFGISPQSE
ncbi:hypothetical protein HZR00_11940 [Elizabethkingia anophelis]|nr:hypothetical protein [Elizabethkingia anophelis]